MRMPPKLTDKSPWWTLYANVINIISFSLVDF